MKTIFQIPFFLFLIIFVNAQEFNIDSLSAQIARTTDDKTRVDLYANRQFGMSNADSTFSFAQKGMKLAQSIGYKEGEMKCQISLSFSAWILGDFATAIRLGYNVLDYAISVNDTSLISNAYAAIINSYRDQGDYQESLDLSIKQLAFRKSFNGDRGIIYAVVGSNYLGLEKYDTALMYIDTALIKTENNSFSGWTNLIKGRILEKLDKDSLAQYSYRRSINVLSQSNNVKDLAGAYNSLAELFEKKSQNDSVIFYANKALKISKQRNFTKEMSEALMILSRSFEKVDTDEALKYYKLAVQSKDLLYNQEKQRQITSYKFNEVLRQNEIKSAEEKYKSNIRTNTLAGSMFTLLIIAILLFISFRRKQKAKQNIELAYDQLKATQSQLIQSEKMASLGELTAGIAHEIQNPLNFVNNFSEVSKELIEEVKSEKAKGKNERDEKLEDELLNDISQNLEKINHHGKRADAIVKGMLQHSRTSSGQKELTDINALADEYLRLSYHGLRAKDKSFNADFKTEFDENLPKINVIPQDIGRVLLNLINNAFYAVQAPPPPDRGIKDPNYVYKPMVIVKTSSFKSPSGGLGVKVVVKDNGPGIPDSIKDKIFQPFFTTKPTGQGTGLGLSLSYDIVKAHGGEIKLESTEGQGTRFIIQLTI